MGTPCRALANRRSASIQVFTGAVPFNDIPSPVAIFAIMQGKRPPHTSNLHRKFVDVDAALLGLQPPLAPGNLRHLTSSPRPVSFSSLSAIVHPPTSPLSHICSERPAWKQLISDTITMDQRVSLITVIFSDNNRIEMVERLSGDDAQAFIDRVGDVSPCTVSHSKGNINANLHILSVRDWRVLCRRSARLVCVIYTRSVAV